MQTQRRIGLFLAGTAWFCGALLMARDFWDKPYREWNPKQVLQILNDSPWAGQVVLTRQVGGRRSSGVSGEKELFDSYTVRLFSALPIRQAYVRMMQIMAQYDEMKPEQKSEFDTKHARALNIDTGDQIIVSLEFQTNDKQLAMSVDRQLKTTTADLLKQQVYLISDRLGRMQLREYYPPALDGTGAKFIFPRSVDGKPVVSGEDKSLKFEFYVPNTDHKVFYEWKVKKMLYMERLEL